MNMDLKPWICMFPIPEMYQSKLAKVYVMVMTKPNYHGMADLLLGGLSATEISLVTHCLGVKSVCREHISLI